MDGIPEIEHPSYDNCLAILLMDAIVPGNATKDGENGADYNEGHRNGHRILSCNDGLIFVTYDHYLTFYEVQIGG